MMEATNAVPSTSGINNEVTKDSAETKVTVRRVKRDMNVAAMLDVEEDKGKCRKKKGRKKTCKGERWR